MHQRAAQTQLLLHAPGELPRQPVLEGAEVGELIQPLEAGRPPRLGHLVQIGVEVDVLADGEIAVQAEALRHVGDPVLDPFGVRRDARAPHQRISRAGPQDAGQHAERGGLARAVRPHQPEQLAGGDVEGEARHRREVAESPREAAQRDRGLRHASAFMGAGRTAV